MATEWPRITIQALIDAGAIVGHKDGNHGSMYPRVEEFGSEGVPFLTAKNLSAGNVDIEGAPRLADEKADALRIGFVRPNDVLLSHNATVGRVAVMPEFEGRILIGTSLTYFRTDPSQLDPRYLAAYFTGRDFQNQLAAVMSQTTRNQVPITSQRTLSAIVPPLPEQKAIARILGTLDDKIELNRRMNATLEAMARALFQSWFVDAVPDSGSLPEGWELSTIGAEAKVVGGSTPSTKSPEFWDNGEFHWVTPKDFSSLQSKVLIGSSRKVTQAGLDQITSGLLPENTVLLSSRAPVGYLALTKIKTAINQGFIAMICHGRLSPEYVMLWADSIMDKIKQAASGTTFAEISKATFRPFPIIVPSVERLDQFTNIVRSFYERIAANERQSVTLAETRDTLLPRLLSGELRTEEVADVG